MKNNKRSLKRLFSFLLALVLVASYLPVARQASAATTGNAFGETGNKVTDPASVNDWKNFFDIEDAANLNTDFAGGVWTDKSVFNSVADYTDATDENDNNIPLSIDPNNFLVALSAIASNKEIEGYSTLPSDTVLMLDLSASMVSNQAVPTLVRSANDAITRLLNLNANNRVAVVAYSGRSTAGVSNVSTAEVILPLGRYTTNNTQKVFLVSSWNGNSGVKVASGVTAQIAPGVTSTFSVNNSKVASGGTYIQNGLYQAWQQLEMATDTTVTEGVQAGIGRTPIYVLMSDGAATAATTDYTDVEDSNVGNGTSSYATNGVAFITQLTAAWVRDKAQEKYGTEPLFYTLGLNVGSNNAAQNLLDPSNHTGTDEMWEDFRDLANAWNKTMDVTTTGNSEVEIEYTDPVGNAWSEHYVSKYFPASNANAMGQAFSDIVEQIEIQSKYYPTFVQGSAINNDGYLEFDDYIGKNMEVKSVKGIQLGNTLYTGATLARMMYSGGMGTVENPTDVGNNLLWSLQKRLNINNAAEVRELLGKAYQTGQLSYNPDTGAYSNYIGWYADQEENFVCFWDGNDASADAVPAAYKDQAYYAIKSYMYYDAVGEGLRKTDMMYATIRVATAVKSDPNRAADVGDVRVLGRLPASLIPLIEYEVDLNGLDVLDPSELTVTGAKAPSRLLYEVGLNDKVDLLDIAGSAPDSLETDANGNYVFYTNQWNQGHHETGNEFSYVTNKNTISFFEPSLENERYYYTYDTPIYADQRGTLYTGATAPTGTVYHRSVTYKSVNGRVTADYAYEPISQHVLSGTGAHSHLLRKADNTWVVKRGTLHHYFGGYEIDKTSNNTQTLDVSFMPFVHDNLDDSALHRFHIDFYLGNNGKLTLDPTEGIKVSKETDSTITDKTASYTFSVYTDRTFSETLRFVKEDAAGVRTEDTITFERGFAIFYLKHGETAWILGDAMTGKDFLVEESDGRGFVVGTINGVDSGNSITLTVTENNIASADFVNTQMPTGSVIIGKGVESTIADHANKRFSFTVSIAGNRVSTRNYTITRSDGQTFTVDAVIPAHITLSHNQYMTISGLPEGTIVTATENDYSADGFTVNQATQSVAVVANSTRYLNYRNTYAARPVTVGTTITVGGTKHMVSDTNIDGTFQFNLDRYIYADNRYEAVNGSTASVTYNNEKGDKSFTLDFSGETYSSTGTYYYRVTEARDETLAAGGIIFDATPFYFSVTVSDNGQGELYISDVTAGTDATVSGDAQSGWNVTGEFTNTYAVDGAAKVVWNIQKKVTGQYGITIPPAGFSFDLYESNADFSSIGDTPVATSSVTGAGGLADIQLVFDDPATDIGDHYYVLKEHVPANKISGVTYSSKAFGMKVTVGHENGHFTLSATTYNLFFRPAQEMATYTGTGTEGVISVSTHAVIFENTYAHKSVTVPISVHKALTGTDMNKDFQYQARQVYFDAQGNVDQYGPAYTYSFSPSNPGDYRMLVNSIGTTYVEFKEIIPDGAVNNRYEGVTYDPSVFIAKIEKIADNQNGVLIPVVTYLKDGQEVSSIIFENSYSAAPAEVTLGATKHLEGNIRKLQKDAYQFELVKDGAVVQTVSNGVPTDDYNAPVTFGALTFTEPGTYNYTIREKIHPDANASNNYTVHGVTYDTHEYPVVVNVYDPGNGQLEAQVSYTGITTEVPRFVNRYTVTPTYYDITAEKVLTGDLLERHDPFFFYLYEAHWDTNAHEAVQGNLLASITNSTDGSIVFSHNSIDELNFDSIGAYRFIIRELLPVSSETSMIFDTHYYMVELDVTDNLSGGLTVSKVVLTRYDVLGNATPAEKVVFNNVLPPEPVVIPFGGIKLYNKALYPGQFTFEMYEAQEDGTGKITAVGEPVLTATNNSDGTFTFQDTTFTDPETGLEVATSYLTYTAPGEKLLVIKEKIPDGVDADNTLDGVTYDDTIYEIRIVVTETTVDGRDTLTYQMLVNNVAGDPLVFENAYNATTDDKLVISGEKVLTGRDLKDGEFSFGLYTAVLSSTGDKVFAGKLLDTAQNKDGKFTFSEISFSDYEDAGSYLYVVKEIVPEDADETITYDDTAYVVVAELDDNDDGTMTLYGPVWAPLNDDGTVPDQPSNDPIIFTNVYTPPRTDVPQTGDTNQPILWAVLLGLSFLGAGAVLILSKKKQA